jgi:hypothetical protein
MKGVAHRHLTDSYRLYTEDSRLNDVVYLILVNTTYTSV